MAVVIVGCVGGLFATALPKGTEIPFDPAVGEVLGDKTIPNLFAHMFMNTVAGGMASFILWASYASKVNFASQTVSPVELGAALSTGLVGISTVRNLIAKAQTSPEWVETAKDAAKTVKALDSSENPTVIENEPHKEAKGVRPQGQTDDSGTSGQDHQNK